MKNNKLKYILCFVLATISLFAFACASKVTLVDFKNDTQNVALLSYYVIDDSNVYDTKGNAYSVTASVKDSKGNDVDFSTGRFLVTDRDGYTVKYTANTGSKKQTKTITLTVYNSTKPIVRIIDPVRYAEIGQVYALPSATAVDALGNNLDVTYAIYNAENVEQVFDTQNKTFTPETSGTYTVVATAVDADNNKAEEKYELFVRLAASANEYESFDDEGSFYRVTAAAGEKSITYHDSALGRTGVMQFDIESSHIPANILKVLPRKSMDSYVVDDVDKDDNPIQRAYNYVVFTAYFEADENTIYDFTFLRGNSTYKLENKVNYNQWTDYVFPASAFITWMGYNEPTGGYNEIRQHFWGIANKDYSLYLDKIVFADTLEEVNGTLEEVNVGEEVSLKSALTTESNKTLDFNVYMGGKLVEKTDDKFVPQWKGTYKVVAQVSAPEDGAVAKNEFTLTVNGVENGHVAKINDYTSYIVYDAEDESTHNYVLPKIEIFESDGSTPVSEQVLSEYTFKQKITRMTPAGVYTYNADFSQTMRGYLNFDLTAEHPTYGSFRMFADVIVGPIANNEVVDFEYADAIKQVASRYGMTLSGAMKNILGESDPERYQGDMVAHFERDQISDNGSTYFNFMPARSMAHYQDLLDSHVDGTKKLVVRIPVYAETSDSVGKNATRTAVKVTAFGVDFNVPTNKWTNLDVPLKTLITWIDAGNLYTTADWYSSSASPVVIAPTSDQPFFDKENPNAARIDLDFYLGSIMVEEVDIIPPTVEELENVFDATESDLYKLSSASTNANIHIASEEELALISAGDTGYTGGAAVVTFGVGNCPDLALSHEMRTFINNEWFPDLCGYTFLSIMYAVKPSDAAIQKGKGIVITSGLLWDSVGKNFSFGTSNMNTWQEYLVPIETLLSYGDDVNKFRLAVPWFSDQSTAPWTAYVGEIKLVKITPTLDEIANPLIVSEDTVEKVFSWRKVNGLATTEELAAIRGTGTRYSGQAVSVEVTNSNGPVLVYPSYVRSFINHKWYPEFQGYKYMTFMLAVKPSANFPDRSITVTSGLIRQLHSSNISFGASGTYPVNQWIRFVIPIETVLEYAGDEDKITLFSTWFANDIRGDENAWTAYLGDVKLVKEYTPEVYDVENIFIAGENAATDIVTSYGAVDATADDLALITAGNYTGKAVKFKYDAGNGASFRYDPAYLDYINNEKYADFCGYKYISFNLAFTSKLNKGTTFCSGLLKDANGGNLSVASGKIAANTWYNFIVPIEWLTADRFDASNKVVILWSAWKSTWADEEACMYVGDIKLIKDAPAASDYTITFNAPVVG